MPDFLVTSPRSPKVQSRGQIFGPGPLKCNFTNLSTCCCTKAATFPAMCMARIDPEADGGRPGGVEEGRRDSSATTRSRTKALLSGMTGDGSTLVSPVPEETWPCPPAPAASRRRQSMGREIPPPCCSSSSESVSPCPELALAMARVARTTETTVGALDMDGRVQVQGRFLTKLGMCRVWSRLETIESTGILADSSRLETRSFQTRLHSRDLTFCRLESRDGCELSSSSKVRNFVP